MTGMFDTFCLSQHMSLPTREAVPMKILQGLRAYPGQVEVIFKATPYDWFAANKLIMDRAKLEI